MKKLLLLAACLLLTCAVNAARSPSENGIPGCGFGVPGANMDSFAMPGGCAMGIPQLQATSTPPVSTCSSGSLMNGKFDLTNTCNNIYVIGALK